jgi:hypothetical protein
MNNNSTMDLPVELVGLLKHAGVDGKKSTWDLQVNEPKMTMVNVNISVTPIYL